MHDLFPKQILRPDEGDNEKKERKKEKKKNARIPNKCGCTLHRESHCKQSDVTQTRHTCLYTLTFINAFTHSDVSCSEQYLHFVSLHEDHEIIAVVSVNVTSNEAQYILDKVHE